MSSNPCPGKRDGTGFFNMGDNMKKFFAPALAAVCMLGMALPVAASAKQFKEIKFGVDATYPPFESLSPPLAPSRASTLISARPSAPS